MKYLDSIQNLVGQVDAFIEQFNKCMQVSRGFTQITDRLAKIYPDNLPDIYYIYDENEFPLFFKEPSHGFSVKITIMCNEKTWRASLLDEITIEFSTTEHGSLKYPISEIRQLDVQQEICKKITEYFEDVDYNIIIDSIDEKILFTKDDLSLQTYATFDEAKEAARNLAKILNIMYPQVLYVLIIVNEKSNIGKLGSCQVYGISSKSKGETLRSERLSFVGSFVDESTETCPNLTLGEQGVKQLTTLTIITLDADGNMNYDIKRSKDKEEARKEAEKNLKRWLHDNRCTLDKANSVRHGLSLCTKYDNDNCIEVYNMESIAEFQAIIKVFEL